MSVNAYNPVILALDYDDLDKALGLARKLRNGVGVYKIGLELFSKYGPQAVAEVKKLDAEIFLDLKLHDIPNTVYKAAKVACGLGVKFFTVHASGGLEMLKAAQRAVDECPAGAKPTVLGVSILTSIDERTCRDEIGFTLPPAGMVAKFARNLVEAGCGGIVSSPSEIKVIREAVGSKLKLVTPGVRPVWAAKGDHAAARVMTPREAIGAGADYVVVGRPITGAQDPAEAARKVLEEIRG